MHTSERKVSTTDMDATGEKKKKSSITLAKNLTAFTSALPTVALT